MKKILSMFALAAVFTLGALTIVSCSKDDDGDNVEHVYSLDARLETENEELRNSPKFQKANEEIVKLAASEEPTTNLSEVEEFWQILDDESSLQMVLLKVELDKIASVLDDPSLTLVVSVLRDGEEWRSKSLRTSYTGK